MGRTGMSNLERAYQENKARKASLQMNSPTEMPLLAEQPIARKYGILGPKIGITTAHPIVSRTGVQPGPPNSAALEK